MIVDGHLHVFPQIDSPQGYAPLAEKMRILQSKLGGHHQAVYLYGYVSFLTQLGRVGSLGEVSRLSIAPRNG